MNLRGSEARKRTLAYVLGIFALLAVYYIYSQLWATSIPTVTAPAAVAAPSAATATPPARNARTVARTTASLDPTLHMDGMRTAESVTYAGTGRNIFSATAPAAIPKPIQPARPAVRPISVQLPQGPPPPPPIDLRFCGYFASPSGAERQVILVHGDDVVLAKSGDVVLRRYKVLSIAANSILVEDLQNNNQQTIPLTNQ